MANNPHLSPASANAAANAACALANGGQLQIYQGAQPANAGAATTGSTLLATLTMGNPAFGQASNGVATANAIASAAAAASGTAQWFRVTESDGATGVFDGSAGQSGCDLNLSTASIAQGATVSVTSLTYTQPE